MIRSRIGMVTSFDPAALAPDAGTDLYHLTVDGFPAAHFRVESFAGKEAISEPYSFDVVVTAESASDEEIERLALGQRACLVWNVGGSANARFMA
jgi:uncharacterized protein involved in type VI secretion and phage assembly